MPVPRNETTEKAIHYGGGHLRVLGLAGSGKTRLSIERYRAIAARHAPGEVFVLAYSNAHLHPILEQILPDGTARGGAAAGFTYYTLAREILTTCTGRSPRLIEGIEEELVVGQVIREHAGALRSDFRSIRESDAFRRELTGTFHLLLQHGVEGDSLDRLVAAARDARLGDVLRLYRAYRKRLEAAGRLTYYNICREAARVFDTLPAGHPFGRARAWLVDDFQDVDAGQFALLSTVAPPDGEAAVTVFGDPMGAYFGYRGTSARYLTKEFADRYRCETIRLAPVSFPGPTGTDVLRTVAGTVLGDRAERFFDAADARPNGDVHLEVMHDEIDEAYAAAARAHALISEADVKPEEIAVVSNNKPAYESLIRAAFEQRGVPLDTGRADVGGIAGFARALLVLLDDPRDRAAMEAFVTLPFFEAFRETCLGAGAGPRSWKEDGEAARAWLEETAAALAAMPPGDWMTHLADRCFVPVCQCAFNDGGAAVEYGSIARLLSAWAKYAEALEALAEAPSAGTFVELSGVFSTRAQGPAPRTQHVGFYSCREVKGRFFRAVIVLGCSELIFPSVYRPRELMPAAALADGCRRAMPEVPVAVYGARSAQEHLDEEYHLLYLCLTRPTEHQYLFAPRTFAGRDRPAPALVLGRAFGEDAPHEKPRDGRLPPQVRFARAWSRGGEPSEVFAKRLDGLSPMGRWWHHPRAAETIAVERFPLSPSSLEGYATCPRRFFYEKVLRVAGEDTPAMRLGTMFHTIMASFGRDYLSGDRLRAKAGPEVIADAVDEVVGSEPMVRPGSLYDAALRYHLSGMVRATLDLERRYAETYEVTLVEEPVRCERDGQEFTGKVDRVHRTPAGLFVLDYKTGKMKVTGKSLRQDTLAGFSEPENALWQVPLYVEGVRRMTDEWPAAFRYVIEDSDQAVAVTLFVTESDADVPDDSVLPDKASRYAHVTRTEITGLVDRAAALAGLIFEPRAGFERTADRRRCKFCAFKVVCGRAGK